MVGPISATNCSKFMMREWMNSADLTVSGWRGEGLESERRGSERGGER